MARARNIKPSFFDNDELAEIEPLGRLLFIGLWTICDHQGNLEWRAKRVKKQLLAYDDCDIEQLAINLDKSGFVRFYSDSDKIYLNIVNFLKHQNPHKNEREKGTDIPDYSEEMRQAIDLKELTINRDLSGLNQDDDGTNPADSLIPYPDSLNLIPDCGNASPEKSAAEKIESAFEIFWNAGMKKINKKAALKSFKTLCKKQSDLEPGYIAEKLQQDVTARLSVNQFGFETLHPATYLNGERWNDEITQRPSPAVQSTGFEHETPTERTRRAFAERERQQQSSQDGMVMVDGWGDIPY